jgi:hypothetical protein
MKPRIFIFLIFLCHNNLIRRTSGRSLETYKQNVCKTDVCVVSLRPLSYFISRLSVCLVRSMLKRLLLQSVLTYNDYYLFINKLGSILVGVLLFYEITYYRPKC